MDNGERIREARQRAGLTQEELGAQVGVSMRTIGNWERGTTVPLNRLARLREVLDGYWKDQSGSQESVLTQATDVELLAEIARRFARTRERRNDDSSPSTTTKSGAPSEEGEGEKTPQPPLDRLGYSLAATTGQRALDEEDANASTRGEENQDT
ncbi:helix-turn-helix domain-containing protein [Brevibacterium paucivorans]|uniref:helix-turn-helix domain-containing protein n=1 Tax=Brevibacterium paucivorans TaxID=170994 RepID=UPI0032193EDB